jgi:hypothetical protein
MRSEVEPAPFAGLAFHPESSTHHLNQAHRDGEPKSGTSVFASSGGVRLSKRLKDDLLFLRWNANAGIGDREMQSRTIDLGRL